MSREAGLRNLLTDEEVELTVREALDELPDGIAKRIENLAVVIESRAEDPNLLGLYEGIPLTARSHYYQSAADKITIYGDSIEGICATPDEARDQIKRTVLHEVGHHFGISDQRLRELGY